MSQKTVEKVTEPKNKKQGFAAMSEVEHRQIASKGGRAAHEKGTAHKFTPDEATAAGKKGGAKIAEDRQHMADIGKKGGERISQNREYMAEIGRKGGKAVSADRDHMAKIGRKGGDKKAAQ